MSLGFGTTKDLSLPVALLGTAMVVSFTENSSTGCTLASHSHAPVMQ